MKKVLLTFSHVSLITLMLLLTPYAKANMDNICFTAYEDSKDISEYIAKNCERNNILKMEFIEEFFVLDRIASWCRHDREINYSEMIKLNTRNKRYVLICVLYDNKPRKLTFLIDNK